jgi:hypothetical protein
VDPETKLPILGKRDKHEPSRSYDTSLLTIYPLFLNRPTTYLPIQVLMPSYNVRDA